MEDVDQGQDTSRLFADSSYLGAMIGVLIYLWRNVPTATRQQAGAVYAKSGLTGRAELSAYFLEDLLSPDAARR